VWDTAKGEPLTPPWESVSDDVMEDVVFSVDGKRLLSLNADGSARLWDTHVGTAVGEPMRGHDDRVIAAAFSATGERIVTAGADGIIRLWDGSAGRGLGFPWRGHTGPVRRVAFTPDGSRVLSGGEDGSVRLWDVASGLQLGEPWRDSDANTPVSTLGVRSDGLIAASADTDGTLRLWRMPRAAAAAACDVLTRNMSLKRWRDSVSPQIEYRCQCGALPIAADDPAAVTPPGRCDARFGKGAAR